MRYRTVLFDVGETLLGARESFGATYARVLGPMGVEASADDFEAALQTVWKELENRIAVGADRYSQFPGGESGFWLRLASGAIERVSGRPVDPEFAQRALEEIREAFRERDAWEVFDDVPPTLEALKRDGVRLGVVSNWDSRLQNVLERLDLAGYFDGLFVSSLEGVEKPDPAIFHAAVRALDARHESTLHVGDLPEIDLAGARAAGIDGVLVDRRGRVDAEHDPLPDLRPIPALARGEA